MADNIAVTQGSGTYIATDQEAGGDNAHVQRVKLAYAENGVSTAIPGDANGLAVNEKNSGTILTSLQLIDDAVYTDNTGTPSKGVLIMGSDTTSPQAVIVDTDGHLQMDVLTMPTVTANLGATDNAVLDDIAANQTDASQKSQIVDGSGNVIGATANALDVNIKSGASSGTQYTEDAAAAADPVGTAVMLIRADTPAAITTTDGDNVSARGTNKGELYVKHIDSIPVTDNDGTLTVDGTVTANLSATDNAVLDQIELNIDSTNAFLTSIDAYSSATNIDIAAMEVLLTTIDADTGNIATAVQLLDNAVDGNEIQVDIVASLPAGTNSIGKLGANSGTDIGDVTINNSTGASAVNIQWRSAGRSC